MIYPLDNRIALKFFFFPEWLHYRNTVSDINARKSESILVGEIENKLKYDIMLPVNYARKKSHAGQRRGSGLIGMGW